jgi:hypothetical protein
LKCFSVFVPCARCEPRDRHHEQQQRPLPPLRRPQMAMTSPHSPSQVVLQNDDCAYEWCKIWSCALRSICTTHLTLIYYVLVLSGRGQYFILGSSRHKFQVFHHQSQSIYTFLHPVSAMGISYRSQCLCESLYNDCRIVCPFLLHLDCQIPRREVDVVAANGLPEELQG